MTGYIVDNEKPGVRFSAEAINFISPQRPGRLRETPDCLPGEDSARRCSTSGSKLDNWTISSNQIRDYCSCVSTVKEIHHLTLLSAEPALLPCVWIQNFCLYRFRSKHEDCICRGLTQVVETCPWRAVTTLQPHQPVNRIEFHLFLCCGLCRLIPD